ncbi:MAG: succinate CoA transferase [Methylobacteriaceae bacterium]|jgi:succinyl-CoA:acetate CoA-transferase|nr:succinate CoA transferase [Methylobacteriaceae bacterium]
MYRKRIKLEKLLNKVVDADAAAALIKDGMVVGMSGFTKAGEAKVVPRAMSKRAEKDPFKITLMTGASLGNSIDANLAEHGVLARRMPFQADPVLRKAINAGSVKFVDQHLSELAEHLSAGQITPVDVALIEIAGIDEDGGLVLSTSVGNSAAFLASAKHIILELNTAIPEGIRGFHDIYRPKLAPNREPIPVLASASQIGTPTVHVDVDKIDAIVVNHEIDSPASIFDPDAETGAIAGHLVDFFHNEVKHGRMTNSLFPLQAGIGSVANAVLQGFLNSPFENLTMYSEVIQDSAFYLLDSGKLTFASAAALSVTAEMLERFFTNLETYRGRILFRPQEISNNPEVIRRLGILAINTALEADIYGNINSTHVNGTHMMNGIGGSGDFARASRIAVFVTKSLAKDGKISSIVPMVPHVDHNEHDVDILVTELGLADLRGLAPRERPPVIIRNCMHPSYQDMAMDYFERSLKGNGQTPHILGEAFSWHIRLKETGSMLPK